MSDDKETKTEETKVEETAAPAPLASQAILLRHMGYSAETRTRRADRYGHRRKKVVLESGGRIRANKLMQVTLGDFVKNHQKLLELVRVGTLKAFDAATQADIAYDDLVKTIHAAGLEMNKDFKIDTTGLQSDLPEIGAHENHDLLPKDGFPTPPPTGSPETVALADKTSSWAGSSSEAPPKEPEAPKAPEEPKEPELLPVQEDEEVLDAVYTKEDLQKMSRSELNKVALEVGVEKPNKLDSKNDVIDAILSAAEGE